MTSLLKRQINVISHVDNCLSYNISKIERKNIQYLQRYTQFSIHMLTSEYASSYLEFQGHYDDVMMYLRAK